MRVVQSKIGCLHLVATIIVAAFDPDRPLGVGERFAGDPEVPLLDQVVSLIVGPHYAGVTAFATDRPAVDTEISLLNLVAALIVAIYKAGKANSLNQDRASIRAERIILDEIISPVI